LKQLGHPFFHLRYILARQDGKRVVTVDLNLRVSGLIGTTFGFMLVTRRGPEKLHRALFEEIVDFVSFGTVGKKNFLSWFAEMKVVYFVDIDVGFGKFALLFGQELDQAGVFD
jgi:MinD-like ATPase involved in chromosome partitioning or flagellar assembly